MFTPSHRQFFFIILLFMSLIIPFTVIFNHTQQEMRQYAAGGTTTVTIDLSSPQRISQFVTGASHTQDDITLFGDQTAARPILQSSLFFENVPIMGWGSSDPEPSPGNYDWSLLDKRVQFMRSTNTTKMITLCCAPGWMRDPAQADDWKYLDAQPSPAHFQDFANLAKQVAQRYSDVQYFQVWNELKGFYNASLNRWDYEGYTTFYNMVYDAIKSVRPDAKIGGPYAPIDIWADKGAGGWPAKDSTLYNQPWGTIDQRSLDAMSYWLINKHGGDFIVFDGGTGTREGSWPTDEFTSFNYYPLLFNWIRKQSGGATLSIGSAEWYPNTPTKYTDINHDNAVFAHGLITMITSGYWYALPWGTQGDAQGLNAYPASFMTSTGQPTVEYTTMKAIKDYFGPGTQLYKTTVSSNDITVLAAKSKTMLVNHLGNTQTVNVNGITVNLNPYQVSVIDTLAGISISPTETVSQIPTTNPATSIFNLTILLHGLGKGGDNVNPNSLGNPIPLHLQRIATVSVSGTQSITKQGIISYDPASGNFKGSIDMGNLSNGSYIVDIKVDGFLQRQESGIITVSSIQTTLPSITLTTGDINNDNQLDLLDYNILIGCFGSKANSGGCVNRQGSDLSDDGQVDGTDYNLFLRELSVQRGG